MKLDTTKIDGFDAMTLEQQIEALKNYEFDENKNDDEIKKLKDIISNKNSESAEWKRKFQDTLSETEKAKAIQEEELAKMKADYEALKQEREIAKLVAEFTKLGYSSEMANDSASALLGGDYTKLFANSTKFKDDLEKSLRADITKNTPTPSQMGGSTKPKSKDDILNIKDPHERQKAIAENIELFNKGE